jgi:hypothetical protein
MLKLSLPARLSSSHHADRVGEFWSAKTDPSDQSGSISSFAFAESTCSFIHLLLYYRCNQGAR